MSEAPAGGKVCMVVLEGIGCSDNDQRNAVKKANMEYLNSLKVNENCIYRELDASGLSVYIVICVHCRWEWRQNNLVLHWFRYTQCSQEGDEIRIALFWTSC